jgi:hypothetical protein
MEKIDSKDIEIIQPSKIGRPNFEFTPKVLDQKMPVKHLKKGLL